MVILFLVFWGISVLFSIVAVPICIPTNSVQELLLLHTLSCIWYLKYFNDGPSEQCEMITHCSVDCIFLILGDVEHLFICFWPPVCLLWRNIYLDLLPIFSLFFFKTFNFILGNSQLTMLWQFQVDSKGTQPYTYVYPFSPKLPSYPGCHIPLSRVPCAI